jgi:WD40 repeat protein
VPKFVKGTPTDWQWVEIQDQDVPDTMARDAEVESAVGTHASLVQTYGASGSYRLAKTSRTDQLPSWADIPDKPATFPPSAYKSTHASGGSDVLTPADIGAVNKAGDTMTGDLTFDATGSEKRITFNTGRLTYFFGHPTDKMVGLYDVSNAIVLWECNPVNRRIFLRVPTYIEGYLAWHAGNDGAGSGLDADKIDGYDTPLPAAAIADGAVTNAKIQNKIEVACVWAGDFSHGAAGFPSKITPIFPWPAPVKLADPATLPTGYGYGVAWSPNGEFLAVAHVNSPYITIYQRSGTTFTKLADPATLPTNHGYGVAWSPNGEFLAVAHINSPYITIYQTSADMPAEGIVIIKGMRREGT